MYTVLHIKSFKEVQDHYTFLPLNLTYVLTDPFPCDFYFTFSGQCLSVKKIEQMNITQPISLKRNIFYQRLFFLQGQEFALCSKYLTLQSDRERFAQVAHDKRATLSESLLSLLTKDLKRATLSNSLRTKEPHE